jgi:hypothetical protein
MKAKALAAQLACVSALPFVYLYLLGIASDNAASAPFMPAIVQYATEHHWCVLAAIQA